MTIYLSHTLSNNLHLENRHYVKQGLTLKFVTGQEEIKHEFIAITKNTFEPLRFYKDHSRRLTHHQIHKLLTRVHRKHHY